MYEYRIARPNESRVSDYLEETCADYKSVAESLLGWLSDDDVRSWAEVNGYEDIFYEDEDEDEDEDDD